MMFRGLHIISTIELNWNVKYCFFQQFLISQNYEKFTAKKLGKIFSILMFGVKLKPRKLLRLLGTVIIVSH